MKFLLAALNAKYIHSNPGIYSLKAYAEKYGAKPEMESRGFQIEIGEYTINNQPDEILKDIYTRKPDAIGFSCYIWNIAYVLELVRDLPKVLPHAEIWLGGPEVSYDAAQILSREPAVYGIMMGEGEETFLNIVRRYMDGSRSFGSVGGTAVRDETGKAVENPLTRAVDMSSIPFLYEDLKDFDNRIIYYESSRGCPFSCSYCLSSLDKSVRFRDTDLVLKELEFFLENRVPQVKFVESTLYILKRSIASLQQRVSLQLSLC